MRGIARQKIRIQDGSLRSGKAQIILFHPLLGYYSIHQIVKQTGEGMCKSNVII
jgi:hypothetical protein